MRKIMRCFYLVLFLGLVGISIYSLVWYWAPKSVDYKYLEKLLRSGDWENADRETSQIVLLKASGRNLFTISKIGVDVSEFKNFPCQDLLTIDRLWLKYSDKKFGFITQQVVWQSIDEKIPSQDITQKLRHFAKQVQWTDDFSRSANTFYLITSKGHLPSYASFGI
jgi:GUN4-like